jgi:hypothetical protein
MTSNIVIPLGHIIRSLIHRSSINFSSFYYSTHTNTSNNNDYSSTLPLVSLPTSLSTHTDQTEVNQEPPAESLSRKAELPHQDFTTVLVVRKVWAELVV